MAANITPLEKPIAAQRVGSIAAWGSTVLGAVYFLVIGWAMLTGRFRFPPPEDIQVFGGIISLVACPALVIVMAALHAVTPPARQVWSVSSLGFTLLFALSVSINRFSQLGVVRQAVAAGHTEGLNWFLAYGDVSIFLGLEYLGWAWFLGLAMFCAAPLFSGGRLANGLRGLMILYGALGLISALGFLLGNWLSLLGFAAWGVVLYFITALLAVYFGKISSD